MRVFKQLRQSESVSPEEDKELRKFAVELKGDEKKFASAAQLFILTTGRIIRKCHHYLPGFEKADEARVKKFLRSIATPPPAAAGKQ